jgi:ABC-type transport system involved in cytochrome c biogenesis ATPase subunit
VRKTTTLRLIAGFEEPTAGRILLHVSQRVRGGASTLSLGDPAPAMADEAPLAS